MWQFLIALLLCLLVAPAAVSANRSARTQSHRAARAKSSHRTAASHARSPRRPASSRTSPATRRRGKARRRAVVRQTQPDAARTREIQEALRREGYLAGSATGKWDEATRAAMARYQQDHGFTVTGKPDSRSLIKLGLGPNHENLLNPPPSPPQPSPPSEN